MSRRIGSLVVLPILALACSHSHPKTSTTMSPTLNKVPATPPARKDPVVDTYPGNIQIPDPYRYMEDPADADTRAFITAQNERFQAALDKPLRDKFRSRLEELVNYPRIGTPQRLNDSTYLVTKNSGLQPHSVTYLYKGLADPNPQVFLDPNTFSEDKNTRLSTLDFSEDAEYAIYGKSVGGSDNQTFYVRHVPTGADLPEVFTDMRFSGTAWKHDNSGFFFTRYPDPTKRLNEKVYYHTLKTADPIQNAKVIYERTDNPELGVGCGVTEDGNYLVLSENIGTDPRPGYLVQPLSNPAAKPIRILEHGKHEFSLRGNDGDTFYAITDAGAPRSRLVKFDLNNPTKWETVIPEFRGKTVLQSAGLLGDTFIVSTVEDARSRLYFYSKDGKQLREIVLPTLGTGSASYRRKYPDELFINFTSYTYPNTVFTYDLKSHTQKVWHAPGVPFTPDQYETVLKFATSKDGTKVPVFITHKKGLKLNGQNPTLLYAYGGFNNGIHPAFSSGRIALLEQGVVYAHAGLRGGDEYGSAWHEAGMLEKKQNVFDDFHACAEMLAKEKYTSPKHLAIQGGSNGGLLVAATMLQRPDLYGSVICQVPVADMLRFHRFGTGRFWTTEYGNADKSEAEFKTLRAYSPVHNVKPGATYPPCLITTGDGDDRVVSAHSLKFAAALIEANPANPTYLRYETSAGHGGGVTIQKALDASADTYAFLFQSLGIPFTPITPTAK